MTAAEGNGLPDAEKPKLLAGGNPQLPKGDGDDLDDLDDLDEGLVTSWITQASELPGWVP